MITVAPRSKVTARPRRNADRTDLSDFTREIWSIILLNKDDPAIYYQEASASLVHLHSEKNGAYTIVPATLSSVAFLLSDIIEFYREKKGRLKNDPLIEVDAKPPVDLVQMVLGNPPQEVPRLKGVTNIPYFTKTGCLIEKPGYNKESGLYLKQIVDVPSVP